MKLLVIVIIGFIIYKIGGAFFEEDSRNPHSVKNKVTAKLVEEYENKNISVTAVMGNLMIIVGSSTMIDLPSNQRETKATKLAERALELYGKPRETVIISLASHRDGVTQLSDYIFKVINGKLVLEKKDNE